MDREKVIKAIDICLGHGICNDCPYCLSGKGCTTMNCCDYMLRDALDLLKEQEAVKPTKANNPDESEYCCGICGYPLWLDEFYCAHCGRRIEWEGR